MNQNSIIVSDVIERFRRELLPIYPRREIQQFISLAFEDVLGYSKVDLIINREKSIPLKLAERFYTILEGLKVSKPIQYILGKTVFYGLQLNVNKHVLIPRPETEELIHWILKDKWKENLSILDLGTGSGCIALSLKDKLPKSSVCGVDVSIQALNIANQNALNNGLNVDFFQFDIIKNESLGFMKFDLIVSNPPYVNISEMEWMAKNVLDHEPHSAIFVKSDDPIVFYRKIADLAEGHLNKKGKLFLEINEAYGSEIVQLLQDRGYDKVTLKKDLNGKDRMVSAIKV